MTLTHDAATRSREGNGTFRDFVLAELKCAVLRSRLMTAEIDSINAALRGNFITADDAIAWLDECGGLQYVAPTPQSTDDDRAESTA
ncbi:MAG TPA: hypothetical protein VGJ68_02880 [Bradyrhizobium sp.]|jgi:hypothetical protein